MEETSFDLKPARKAFSRIGFAMSAILVIATVLQLLYILIPKAIWGPENWFVSSSWGMWIGSFAPLYLVAIPAGLLIMRKLPTQKPEDNKLSFRQLFVFIPMCQCVMYAGNLIGNLLSMLLSGGQAQNALMNYAMDTNPVKILVMVILAPLLEEYVCRKQIIDRTRQYGEKTAVFLSAFVFALLHGNLFQFFYAFALGIIFAYIYTRTGRLRYSVILHAVVNFLGSVVAPWFLTHVDLEAMANLDPNLPAEELMQTMISILPGYLLFMLYSNLLMGLSIFGLVLLLIRRKKTQWQECDSQLPKGKAGKTVLLNVGMILYMVICTIFIIAALFP